MECSSATEGIGIQAFVAKQKDLLQLELRSEQGEESEAAKTGQARSQQQRGQQSPEERPQTVLRGLQVESVTVGLYGRTVVHLESGSSASTGAPSSPADSGGISDGSNPGGAPFARTGSHLLPSHRLTVGDEVEILGRNTSGNSGDGSSGSRKRRNAGGVICALDDATMSIALFGPKRAKDTGTATTGADGSDDGGDDYGLGLGSPPFTVVPKSSAAVHRKMIDALDELNRAGADHDQAGAVIKAIFGTVNGDTMKPMKNTATGKNQPGACVQAKRRYNANLDSSQEEAIDFALGGRSLGLIHGPPGTGKTSTVVELIRRAVYDNGWKVLVTAPSNVAVDNVLEKLVAHNNGSKSSRRSRKGKSESSSGNAANAFGTAPPRKLRAVRLGHPARIKASIQPYSLESLVNCADGTEVVNDVRKELASFVKVLSDDKARYADRRVARREVKVLRSELRQREETVVDDLISSADVVLATNVGAASSALNKYIKKGRGGFDLVVIDEAAQALEASCWIPILRGQRLVLAGDHRQLPPTIKCNDARVQRELGRTMFERVMKMYGDYKLANDNQRVAKGQISRMLKTQYRMNAAIADWASKATYGNNLLNHESVRGHVLSDLPHVSLPADDKMDYAPLLFIDTAGCGMFESVNAAGSRYNEEEARIVAHHVQKLLIVGVDPKEIAVISPYNGQVELLRLMLLPAVPSLEIRSVDGFQGGEREAVILSLVRSSERGGAVSGIGFLRDERRLNVAVTRAKRHCCLIADSETVSRSPFIKGLLRWMEERGEHRSAAEFAPEEITDTVVSGSTSGGSAAPVETKKYGTKLNRPVPKEQVSNDAKMAATKKNGNRSISEEQRRKNLLDKINLFAETAVAGEKMIVGTNMPKFDELVACELAQQLGLDHRYEGPEGINRKLILQKDGAKAENRDAEKNSVDSDIAAAGVAKQASAFAALDMDDDGSDTDESQEGVEKKKSGPSSKNSLLAELARERMERENQRQQEQQPSVVLQPPPSKKAKAKKKKKKTKKGGSKGGGGGPSATDATQDDGIEDDLAFLDSQIEQVQSSHGRKVEGSGKAYKSIINGVLLAKPPDREAKKDVRAQNALREKLKKAGDGRKAKGTNKSTGKKKK